MMKRAFDAGTEDYSPATACCWARPRTSATCPGRAEGLLTVPTTPARASSPVCPTRCSASAGNDGTGAVREIERIANGYGWKVVAGR